jgi:UDP-2,3-diacylglucosamine pyrophosphatase LpxH
MGMRTAIISDLHLGGNGEDVLRDAATRSILLEEIAGADRVVLLGDVVELRGRPLGLAMEHARPFFEELGAAIGDREVILTPGNHDHHLAEPLLDSLSLDGDGALGLEQRHDPSPGPSGQIDAWLGPARLQVAYPGLWLREDVYATHGHYLDAHLALPRAECLAAAVRMRTAGAPPSPATPDHYERVLRPLYGFAYAVAQSRPVRGGGRRGPSEAAWKLLSGSARGAGRRRKLAFGAARAGFPAGIWALNRLLHSSFESDISAAAIFQGGVAAATEMAARLQLEGVHVITGHTHRGGPDAGEAEWPLAGGGRLHNTGSWVFSTVFHRPGTPPNSYWPGTVTWLKDDDPPRRVQLLLDRPHGEMMELVSKATNS